MSLKKFILEERQFSPFLFIHDVTRWDSLTWPINYTSSDPGHRFKFSFGSFKTSQSWRKSVLKSTSALNTHWKDRCWSWSSNILAIWCEELTHCKRPWCWERLKAGGKGDDRGWDGWMASLTQWTWVWASSGSWWWTGKAGVLQSMRLQRVGHDWVTELNQDSIRMTS